MKDKHINDLFIETVGRSIPAHFCMNKRKMKGGMPGMSKGTNSNAMFQNYPDVVDVDNLSLMLGVSKKTAYRLVANGNISAVKVGRSYKIPKAFIVQYLVGNNHADN